MEGMMASNDDIINVVNRLQMMETSFSKILMEAAMKMAALTDANIFLLVETGEGRRFAGKQHLCESFLNEGLVTLPNDVQFELDETNPTALVEKPAFYGTGSNNGAAAGNNASSILTGYGIATQISSPAPTIYHQAAQMAAGGSWNNNGVLPVGGLGSIGGIVQSPRPPTLIRKRPASSIMKNSQSNKLGRYSGGGGGGGIRAPASSPASSHIASFATSDGKTGAAATVTSPKQFIRVKTELNDDGTPVKTTRDLLQDVGNKGGVDNAPVGGDEVIVGDELVPVSSSTTTSSASWDPNTTLALPPDYDGQLMASDWNLGEFLSQNGKVEALKTVNEDSSFTDRDSPMFKLLNSALYDMAKIAAVHCPVKSTKNAHSAVFFVNAFDLFWESMPNLQQMSDRGALCTDSGKNSGLKSYCRNRMQRNFNSLIIRMK